MFVDARAQARTFVVSQLAPGNLKALLVCADALEGLDGILEVAARDVRILQTQGSILESLLKGPGTGGRAPLSRCHRAFSSRSLRGAVYRKPPGPCVLCKQGHNRGGG